MGVNEHAAHPGERGRDVGRARGHARHAYVLRIKRPMNTASPSKAAVSTTRDDLAAGGLGRSARNSVYDTSVARVRSSSSCSCVWSAASSCGFRRASCSSSLRTCCASRREVRSPAVASVLTGSFVSSSFGAGSAQVGLVHPVHRVPEESSDQQRRHLRRVKAHRVLGAKYQAATTSFPPPLGHAIEKARTDAVSEQSGNAGDDAKVAALLKSLGAGPRCFVVAASHGEADNCAADTAAVLQALVGKSTDCIVFFPGAGLAYYENHEGECHVLRRPAAR